jgi:hypothetical protein
MSWQRQLEREEEELERAYNQGEISAEAYRRELRELHREALRAAEEEARDAYDAVMGQHLGGHY